MNIYTVGTFDLLHVGHLALIEYSKKIKHDSCLIVGVASDEVVNLYKPNIPIIPLEQRVKMLSALKNVDKVEPYYELNYVKACEKLNVDVFIIGEDWGSNPHNLAVEDYLIANGKSIIKIKYCPRTSSTKIKSDIVSQFKYDKIIDRMINKKSSTKKHFIE